MKILNHSTNPYYGDIVDSRLSRRAALGVAGRAAAGAWVAGLLGSTAIRNAAAAAGGSSLSFPELKRVYDATHHVAPGYRAEVLIKWGDPLFADSPTFDHNAPSAEQQAQAFGYNCDFIGFVPLPLGSGSNDHGLLCVNHEYVTPQAMFPGMTEDEASQKMTEGQVRVEMAAVGHSIVEVRKENGRWAYVQGSPYNRRIHVGTEMRISGPAAGHDLLKTKADPTGTKVYGTSYNCAGGVTPWGTILSCEEGVSDIFGGDAEKLPAELKPLYERYGFDGSDYYGRGRVEARFRLDEEPNEPHRFDWVVEIDPYDPQSLPVKRTALGRTSHEGATVVVNGDGRIVVYMGDDDYFEYIYRFVSNRPFDPQNREANRDLLDDGVLSVARFAADGTMVWERLVHGEGPLTEANGYASQGDVLVKTRLAAEAVGATRMDRPEGFQANPVTGRVYAVMTKNKKREPGDENPANPRAKNLWGHILELVPPGEDGARDHTADVYRWEVFLLGGDPSDPAVGAKYHPGTSKDGWLVTPDNVSFDPKGRMWIQTDGANDFDMADGVYACDTTGDGRALTRLFFACPRGAEATGACFTPDGKTMFLSVQHPGEDSATLETITTRWPTMDPTKPPMPAVVVFQKEDGGEIGA
jgi:secreted PhoX family phosphatase